MKCMLVLPGEAEVSRRDAPHGKQKVLYLKLSTDDAHTSARIDHTASEALSPTLYAETTSSKTEAGEWKNGRM
jgi:hypothetical protein